MLDIKRINIFEKKTLILAILYLIFNRTSRELLNVYDFNVISLYRLHHVTSLYQNYYRIRMRIL